jgi:HD-GYP domain-containing protein (c-di-GMP phosphodiesterase class II)
VAIAGRLGLLPEEVEGIKIAARLHDIGKLGVSDLILLKPDKLSDKERELVKAHVLVSAHILEALDFPWEVKPAVRFHHERLDGSGYPDGLIGDEIPLSARVLAVADVFSAMTAARSHRAPRPREEAIGEITKHAGTKYDPQVVSAFMQVVEAGGL